jgi:serine phosphatase RsbU (regulator of sigma subunit)
VLGAVREFAGQTPQSDDITVMAFRYRPSSGSAPR